MFAPVIYPPGDPEAIVNAKLVLAALAAGWRIRVIHEADDEPQKYPENGNGMWSALSGVVHGVRPFCCRSVRGVWSRMRAAVQTRGHLPLSWPSLSADLAMRLISKEGCDVILSRSLPLYGHLPALIVSRKLGIPWIANWNDPVPLEKMPSPYGMGPEAKLPFAVERLLRAAALGATWHTFPCERLRRYVCSYLPGRVMERSSVIPHVALDRLRNQQLRRDGVRFSLCYAGNVGPQRRPDVLFQGVKAFLAQRPEAEISMTFITNRPQEVAVAASALEVGDMVNIEAPQPYASSLEAMRRHDVLVVIEAPVGEGIFLPSKLVDYAQSGRPVLALCPMEGTLRDLLTKHGGGIPVDCRSPSQVCEAIGTLYSHWQAGRLDAVYSSDRLFDLFRESRVITSYLRLFQHIQMMRGGRELVPADTVVSG
jgi:hypothetical protein